MTVEREWKDIGGRDPEVLPTTEGVNVPDRVILIDLNRSVLGLDDKVVPGTEDALRSAVSAAKHAGISVGLSSDSPLPPLWRLGNKYGMDGMYLAENGALGYDPRSDKAFTIVGIPNTTRIRSDLVSRLSEQGLHIFPPQIAPEFDEPNEVNGSDGQVGVSFGRNRINTLSIFGVRRQGEGLIPAAQAAEKAAQYLRQPGVLPQQVLLYEDLDSDVAYLAVQPLHEGQSTYRPNKALGAEALRKINPNARIFKIGDDERDGRYGMGEGSVFVGMVANAKLEHQMLADYVAVRPYTEGVVELIYQAIEVLS